MKKVFGIVLALALVLTSVVASAVPAAAVTEGTLEVCLSYPLAKELSDYCISFHNGSTLKQTFDYIDIMFPYGTNATTCSGVKVQYSAAPPPAAPPPVCGPCPCPVNWVAAAGDPPVFEATVTVNIIYPSTIRLHLNSGNITKCMYVLIEAYNITNPCSCEHHLQVGTSTHTPVASNDYTIYCAKIDLVGGKTPAGADKMNLVSLPCYPVDPSIEAVFASLFMLKTLTAGTANPFTFSIWTYDTAAGKWYKYVSDTSFDEIATIDPCKAYWIKPSKKTTIWIHGYPYPPGQGPPIKCCYPPSWNMVGFASYTNMPASQYLFYTLLAPQFGQYCVIAIWGWDPTNQIYAPTTWNGALTPAAANDPTLVKGRGYWMAFLAECCIIPPAQAGC